jgi:hypothetical protein
LHDLRRSTCELSQFLIAGLCQRDVLVGGALAHSLVVFPKQCLTGDDRFGPFCESAVTERVSYSKNFSGKVLSVRYLVRQQQEIRD